MHFPFPQTQAKIEENLQKNGESIFMDKTKCIEKEIDNFMQNH